MAKNMESFKLCFSLFIIGILSTPAVKCTEVSQSAETCNFSLHPKCNYTLSLSPSHGCFASHDDTVVSRIKRSSDIEQQISTELLAKKIKRVQNKLSKEMEHLSTRVLRGVRRIESVVMELVGQQTKQARANPSSCPSGFETVDNWKSCYLMSKFNTSWYDAKDYCNALDSHVVSLLTLKEHYIVTYLIRNNPDVQDAVGWWTSGTFYPKTKQWMWASDTELRPLTYIKWAADEPNELSLQCIMLHFEDELLWHDELCTRKFNFVCKVDLEE